MTTKLALLTLALLGAGALAFGSSARMATRADDGESHSPVLTVPDAGSGSARTDPPSAGIGGASPVPGGDGSGGRSEPAEPGTSGAPPSSAQPATPPAVGAAAGPNTTPAPEAPGAAPGGAADAMAVLVAAGERYRTSTALCADFTQEFSNELLGDSRTGRGRLCQQRPNLFMMRFLEPAGDLVVADGEWLWQYTPSVDATQVLRSRLGQGPGAFDFYHEFLEDPAARYTARTQGQETVGGNATHRIVLVPLGAAGYREATLWIDVRQHLIRRVRIREENGNVRTVSLAAIDLDAKPAAGQFRFVQPPGTQVFTAP